MNSDEIVNEVKKIEEELGETGRLLLRPSGTEPLIRVMVEAETQEMCDKYVSRMVELVEKVKNA